MCGPGVCAVINVCVVQVCVMMSMCGPGVYAVINVCVVLSVCGPGVCDDECVCSDQCVCGAGVCNERAARSLCHPQPAVSTSSLGNVSLLSAGDLRCHPTQDDLPSRPCSTHRPSEQLLRKLSAGPVHVLF